MNREKALKAGLALSFVAVLVAGVTANISPDWVAISDIAFGCFVILVFYFFSRDSLAAQSPADGGGVADTKDAEKRAPFHGFNPADRKD